MAKTILITGANGQLGSEIKAIASQFLAFDFLFTDVDSLDLLNKGALCTFAADKKIDYVINCAAYTAVDKAETEIELCYSINRDAIKNLAEVFSTSRIIHVSTDYVFDGTATRPYRETDPTNPQSVYGKSKLEGEEALLNADVEAIIIRTAWLYSPYGNNFVKTMIRLGSERSEVNVVCDQEGTPTYAADLARSILNMVLYSEQIDFPSGVYHYSNEGKTTWYEFASKVMELAKLDCKVNPIPTNEYPTPAARPKYSVLDKTKIKETFTLPVPQWEESLENCISRL